MYLNLFLRNRTGSFGHQSRFCIRLRVRASEVTNTVVFAVVAKFLLFGLSTPTDTKEISQPATLNVSSG